MEKDKELEKAATSWYVGKGYNTMPLEESMKQGMVRFAQGKEAFVAGVEYQKQRTLGFAEWIDSLPFRKFRDGIWKRITNNPEDEPKDFRPIMSTEELWDFYLEQKEKQKA